MPKLKYKSKSSKHHKSSSKKKKDHSHRHHSHPRQRHYTPPTLYEDEEGSVPPSQATKSTEEEEWRQKLFDAMVDGEDPFYTFYDDSSSSDPRSHQMSDDAYADYINQAMYRKHHADEIAQQEARLRARAKRKAEKEEAQRKMEQEEKKHQQQVHETMRREDRQKQLQRGHDRYTLLWEQLQSTAPAITSRRDVPWPTVGSRITLENVRAFVVNHTTKQLRQEQLRYHPDKFMPRIQQRFKGSEDDLEWIRQKDNEVAGWLNELWAERTK